MTLKRVILVGHCGADSGMLGHLMSRTLGKLPVGYINDPASLEREATADSLLLINRVLDGPFDVDGGVELIRKLKARAEPPVMMLISNYAEAQREAVEAGALPGFGKSQAHDPATAELLKRAVDAGD